MAFNNYLDEQLNNNGMWTSAASILSNYEYTSKSLGLIPGTDITVALNNALNSIGAEKSIYFYPGTYIISDTITIANNGVTIKGAGRYATKFQFTPTTDKECFKFSKGASISFNCGITDCTIYTPNTTNRKVAIACYDTSELLINNVMILSFIGKDSVGIQWFGRENNTVDNVRITSDICIRFSPNPNTLEWLSIDHCVIRDSYLTGSNSPTSGGTMPTTLILIDDKSMISGLTIEGRNAWVRGQRGLYNVDSTGTMASYMVKISNVRREQPSSTTYESIHIERTNSSRLQSLNIENFYTGVGQKDFYFRGVDFISLKNVQLTNQTYNVLDIDNCTSMEWTNVFFSSNNSSLFLLPNMEMVRGCQRTESRLYPNSGSWEKKPVALYQQRPINVMNGAKSWEYSGTLADSATIQLPINTTNGYKVAMVDVAAVSDDGTIFEQGSFSFGAVAGVGQTGTITSTTSSPNITITGGTFPTTLVGMYIFIGELEAGKVSSVAVDGLTLTLQSNSLIAITNSTNWHGIAVNDTIKGVKKLNSTANITNINTAGKLMVWCNSGSTPLLNNVYFYNRLGKQVTIIARATFI
jgi:hypothetical protein